MASVAETQYSRTCSYKSAPIPNSKPINNTSSPYTPQKYNDKAVTSNQPQYLEQQPLQRPSSGRRHNSTHRVSSYWASCNPEGLKPEDDEAVAQTLSWIPRAPYTHQGPRQTLKKPVAIPQIDAGGLRKYMPFTRAYSPVLQNNHVRVEEFIAFVDNLAVAQAPLPPLQAVAMVGMGISSVPHHWSQLVGDGVNFAGGAGPAATSRIRTHKYLKEANQQYFAPRGLKVRLARDSEIFQLVRCPETMPLLNQSPSETRSGTLTLRDRRLRALDPYISPLTYDVPPPTQQKTLLDRISAKQVDEQLARPYRKASKEHPKYSAKLESETGSRGSLASISTLSSSSDSDSDSDSELEAFAKSNLENKIKSLQLEIRKINLVSEGEILKAESKDSKKAHEVEERRLERVTKAETEMERLKKQRVDQATIINSDQAERQAAQTVEKASKSRMEAEKQLKSLNWIIIDNLDSPEVATLD